MAIPPVLIQFPGSGASANCIAEFQAVPQNTVMQGS